MTQDRPLSHASTFETQPHPPTPLFDRSTTPGPSKDVTPQKSQQHNKAVALPRDTTASTSRPFIDRRAFCLRATRGPLHGIERGVGSYVAGVELTLFTMNQITRPYGINHLPWPFFTKSGRRKEPLPEISTPVLGVRLTQKPNLTNSFDFRYSKLSLAASIRALNSFFARFWKLLP